MPKVASKAQWNFFKNLVKQGRMSKQELEKRTRGVNYSSLPARKGKKRSKKRRTRKKTTTKGKRRTTKRRRSTRRRRRR